MWEIFWERFLDFLERNFEKHNFCKLCYRRDGQLEKCSCRHDGFSCKYTDEDTFLLIADGDQIHKISILDRSVYRDDFVVVPDTYGIVGLAIDQENNNLYFSDISYASRGIYKVSLSSGTSQGRRVDRVVSDVYEPTGIAVDWISKNIYYCDAQYGAIFMTNKNGKFRRQVLSGLTEPRYIAIDPLQGVLFWTEYTGRVAN